MDLTKYICQHRKRFFNVRTGNFQYTDCGYCDVCITRRNARNYSILVENAPLFKHKLFITLTYSNDFLPKAKVIIDHKNKQIYTVPWSKRIGDMFPEGKLISNLSYEEKNIERVNRFISLANHLPLHPYETQLFGIIYYPDVQRFFKRLRINYQRETNKKADFRYFVLAEYGAKYFRPHFHLVLFFDNTNFQEWIFGRYDKDPSYRRKYRLKDWEFGFAECERPEGDEQLLSYISGYVSSIHRDAYVLSEKKIKQKTRFSNGLSAVSTRDLLADRVRYLHMSIDDIKNILVKQQDKSVNLFDSAHHFTALFPKCPIITPRNINEYFTIFRVFKREQNESIVNFVIRMMNDVTNWYDNSYYFRSFYDYLQRRYEETHPSPLTDEDFIEYDMKCYNYIISVVRQMFRFVRHYEPLITGNFVKDYVFFRKLQNVWDYFEEHRLGVYFATLESLQFPCFSICDDTKDVYSNISQTYAKEKQLKAKNKKLHNDKVSHSI